MVSVAASLRRFIAGATRAFHGARAAFATIVAKWKSSIVDLGQRVRSLADRFASLPTTKGIGKHGEDVVLLGHVEGREFTRMLRTGRSAAAFERATGKALSPLARSSFRHLDDIAELHFPDSSLMRRATYTKSWRDAMVSNGVVKSGERVVSASALEKLIRSDAVTLKRTNSLLGKIARHKKLVFLGATVAVVGGIGIAGLCHKLAEYALSHSGCFMYTRDLTNGVRKCRVVGCSCPITETRGGGDNVGSIKMCDETDMWEKMRLSHNQCAEGAKAGRTEPFCVHCDWDESDPDSLDFVDKDKLRENAYLKCETIDAVDALNESVGNMVDNAFGVGNKIAGFAKESLASSANVLPWVFGAVVVFVAIIVGAFLWRFSGFGKGGGGGGGGGDDPHHHHEPLLPPPSQHTPQV